MKTLLRIGIPALFILAALYFLKQRNSGTLQGNTFGIENIDAVAKIYMADRYGKEALLERHEGYWSINGRYKARQTEVELLLRTLRNIRIVQPVPEAAEARVRASIEAENTVVEVYDAKGKRLQRFYVGPEETNRGNWMNLDGREEIYLVQYPGFTGHLSTRFFLDEADWRQRTIATAKFADLKRVTISYPFNPENSFALEVFRRDSFGVAKGPNGPFLPANPKSAVTLLRAFENLNAEVIINSYPKQDSVLATTPYCAIVLELSSGESKNITLYRKPIDKRSKKQFTADGEEMVYDVERFYAHFQSPACLIPESYDFAIVQLFAFQTVLLSYHHLVAVN